MHVIIAGMPSKTSKALHLRMFLSIYYTNEHINSWIQKLNQSVEFLTEILIIIERGTTTFISPKECFSDGKQYLTYAIPLSSFGGKPVWLTVLLVSLVVYQSGQLFYYQYLLVYQSGGLFHYHHLVVYHLCSYSITSFGGMPVWWAIPLPIIWWYTSLDNYSISIIWWYTSLVSYSISIIWWYTSLVSYSISIIWWYTSLVIYLIKPRLHIHNFLYDSPRFTTISHGQKNRDGSG